jgi:nucleoid DNA-binding protein
MPRFSAIRSERDRPPRVGSIFRQSGSARKEKAAKNQPAGRESSPPPVSVTLGRPAEESGADAGNHPSKNLNFLGKNRRQVIDICRIRDLDTVTVPHWRAGSTEFGSPVSQEVKMAAVAKAKSISKSEILKYLSDSTELSKKQITSVIDALSELIGKNVGKKGPGVIALPGLVKIKVIQKPAQPAKKGVPNPFRPGELMDVPAKPASRKVKVLPLKALKDMVK